MKFSTLLVIISLSATGCSSVPKNPEGGSPDSGKMVWAPEDAIKSSKVRISYVLGHTHYEFIMESQEGQCQAQLFADRKLLKEAAVDSARYADFLGKAAAYLGTGASSQRTPSSQASCRTPYTVTISVSSKSRSDHGCRGHGEGGLSRLIREGEFLLYSKK